MVNAEINNGVIKFYNENGKLLLASTIDNAFEAIRNDMQDEEG